ncbi:MAG TPA: LptF/LptG family permease [Opitutaceae bacterium]|nr:LptF/LptG family permease [Opitutaceae bacterium]
MTTTLDRYIFRNVLFSSLAAVGVCTFVLMVGNVIKDLLQAFASEQIDLPTFLRLAALVIPSVMPYALPLGMLTGVLLVLGRLSAQQEITAMRAAGWGVVRIARPIFVLAAISTALMVWFACELSPKAKTTINLIRADTARVNPLSFIVPGEFVRTFPGKVIHVAAKDGTSVRDLSFWELDAQGRVVGYLRAETGTVDFDDDTSELLITPKQGVLEVRNTEKPDDFSREPTLIHFAEWKRIKLPLDKLVGQGTYKRKLSILTYAELREELAKAKAVVAEDAAAARARRQQITRVRYAMQKQLTLAAGVLAFAMVGVPLGITMQRKETSANLGLAVVLALGYLFFQMIIDWSQKRPDLHPELLVWLPFVVFAGLGGWLFWRVDRQ